VLSNARTLRPAARWASLVTAAALVAAAGCESNKDTRSTRSTTGQRSDATVRTASQTGGATTRTVSTRGMRQSSATLDNVLRVTKYLPEEVIAGQPFEYQVTVENTSDNLVLQNVWIREHAGATHSPGMGGQTAMHGGTQPTIQTTSMPTQTAAGHADHTTTKTTTQRASYDTRPDHDVTLDTRDQAMDRRQDPTRPDIRTTGFDQSRGFPTPGPGGAEQSDQPGRLRDNGPQTDQSRRIRDEEQQLNRDLRDMARQSDMDRRDSGGVINQSELARQPLDSGQRDAFGDPYQRPRTDTAGPNIQTTSYQQRSTTTTQQVGGWATQPESRWDGGWDNRWDDRGRTFRPVGAAPMGGSDAGPSNDYFIGDLGPGESRTITISGVVPGAGQQMICTSAAYTPVMCAMVNAIQPYLRINKTGPEEASVGQEITWQVTVTNTGVGPARDVMIIDPLPGDMRTANGENQVQIDVGTLNAGESKTFTVSAVAPTTGRFTNIARVTAAGGLSDEAQASTNVRQARLEIQKRGPEVEYTNIGADFEITVTNTGDAPAHNVVLEDLIPTGARFLEASENASASQDRVTWNLGTIPPGQSRTILVRMAGTQAGTLENCAVVSALGVEPARDCTTVRFEGITALLLEVVDIEDPIRVGGRTAYDITVVNQGTADATNVALEFELDERTSLQNAEGPSPFARTETGAAFRPIDVLAPGQRVTFRVFVNADAAGDTRFRVNMRADQLTRPVVETESTRIVE